MTQRRILLSGTNNTRDLGGWPREDGGTTVWGRFVRTDMPTGVTAADIKLLQDMKITTVIDLRSDGEHDREVSALEGIPGFLFHRYNLLGDRPWDDAPERIAEAYLDMTKTEAMANVMRVIAEAPAGVLFHCRAGKDRTSVVAAVLLMLAGVSRSDIMADYILSTAYLRTAWLHRDIKFPLKDFMPQLEYIDDFMAAFEEMYGTARSYLEGTGLTAGQVDNIHRRLTVKP